MKKINTRHKTTNKEVSDKRKKASFSKEDLLRLDSFKSIKKIGWADFELFCEHFLKEVECFEHLYRTTDEVDAMGIDLTGDYKGDGVGVQCKHFDQYSRNKKKNGIYFKDIQKFMNDVHVFNAGDEEKIKHAVFIASAPEKLKEEEVRILEKLEKDNDIYLWIVDSKGINMVIRQVKKNYDPSDLEKDGFKGYWKNKHSVSC